MRILITGSAGHLGEGLARALHGCGHDVVGVDLQRSGYTTHCGSIADRELVERCMRGVDAVLHTATLHKPHVATHSRQAFVDTNITGTLNLLEEAAAAGVAAFVYTSTTSVFGAALQASRKGPAVWVTEESVPTPRNIYGVTKRAAEDLCELFHRKRKLPCLVLRTSRFFPDEDDDEETRGRYADDNVKVNEYLHRRADIEDVVGAHLLAIERAAEIGFARYIVSATTPFSEEHAPELGTDAAAVVRRLFPRFEREYARRGWSMFPTIDRVYVNARARRELGWEPRYHYAYVLERLAVDEDFRSALARAIGVKGYHGGRFAGGRYPVER